MRMCGRSPSGIVRSPSVTRIHSAFCGTDKAMHDKFSGRETGVMTLSCSSKAIDRGSTWPIFYAIVLPDIEHGGHPFQHGLAVMNSVREIAAGRPILHGSEEVLRLSRFPVVGLDALLVGVKPVM